jgi:hypothetical protein
VRLRFETKVIEVSISNSDNIFELIFQVFVELFMVFFTPLSLSYFSNEK